MLENSFSSAQPFRKVIHHWFEFDSDSQQVFAEVQNPVHFLTVPTITSRTKHCGSFVKPQTRCKPTAARWRLGVKAEVRAAAQRNAPRSACVIINGCQRLFSGRRRWQTALQKHWDCVNASVGWMRELRALAKRLWQMIQVTKPGRSPSSAAIWGIPGHLYKLWESVNWSVTPAVTATVRYWRRRQI